MGKLDFTRPGKPSGKPGMSDDEVRRLRQSYIDGKMTSREIREFTGLSGETIARMLRGDTYSHVTMNRPTAVLMEEAEGSLREMVRKGFVKKEDGSVMTLEEWDEQQKSGGPDEPLGCAF